MLLQGFISTVGPRLSEWLGPEKVPNNRKKITVLDYWDCGIARIIKLPTWIFL